MLNGMAQRTPWTYLKRHRIRSGYSQPGLATAVEVHVSHIGKIEKGDRGASPELYKKLAAALNVDIDELIASAPTPPSQTPTRQIRETCIRHR